MSARKPEPLDVYALKFDTPRLPSKNYKIKDGFIITDHSFEGETIEGQRLIFHGLGYSIIKITSTDEKFQPTVENGEIIGRFIPQFLKKPE